MGRGRISYRVDIQDRPAYVETKKRPGDWEGDTLVGFILQGAMVSMVESLSKFRRLALIQSATAGHVNNAMDQSLNRYEGLSLKSITTPPGLEFSWHEELTKRLGVACFFDRPYHSRERGLNEYTHGLVRPYLPKKTDFLNLDESVVFKIEAKQNNRPRKELNDRTP